MKESGFDMVPISDANDRATVLADANTFFTQMGYFQDSDANEEFAIFSATIWSLTAAPR